jgi:PTS system nitrogen regulatory IIA component
MGDQDFDIDSLAAYLHLTPPQVQRLADRGNLPGRKVAGQWRFHPSEIHHWLEERIGVLDDEELAQMEGVLHRGAPADQREEICIAEMLPVEAIAIPLAARTRGSVIRAMAKLAARTGWLWDPDKMIDAVAQREDMYPTAQENGVALMHPRRPMSSILGQALLALGRTTTGIPFGGGGTLTDVFFLICSVEDRMHLRVLARLSRIVSTPGFLEALREAPDAVAAHRLIEATEREIAD